MGKLCRRCGNSYTYKRSKTCKDCCDYLKEHNLCTDCYTSERRLGASYCLRCTTDHSIASQRKHEEKTKKQRRQCYENNKERLRPYRIAKSAERRRNRTEEERLSENLHQKEKMRKLRESVIIGYGGKCVCCEESTYEFLTLDHVLGDGKEERSRYYPYQIHRKILQDNFPSTYQVLCYNCNLSKGAYGACPHLGEAYTPVSDSAKSIKKARKKIIDAYGGACECCGANKYEFLAIDHKLNNGSEDRKMYHNTTLVYKIIKDNFPAEYGILCHNCNCARHYSKDKICPHNFIKEPIESTYRI